MESGIVEAYDDGQLSMMNFFLEQSKTKMKFNIGSGKTAMFFVWDEEMNIWMTKRDFQVEDIVGQFFLKHIRDRINECSMQDRVKASKLGKVMNAITKASYIKDIVELLKGRTSDEKFMNIVDRTADFINFRNGKLNLRTGEFSRRDENDFFTKYLDYDYNPEVSQEKKNEVYQIFLRIDNDDEVMTDFDLRFLGYTLTGEMGEQKFLIYSGPSAENGKSTKLDIFSKCFPIYSFKFGKKTFCEDYVNAHKQFSSVECPIRLSYIEELERNKIDADRLKDFVDGKINNEIMYGTTKEIRSQCKLIVATNHTPNFTTDNGIRRRMLICEMNNKFVDAYKYTGEKGTYIKDINLVKKFDNDEYKNAFVQLLLLYSKEYYKNGLKIPRDVLNEANNLCEENDTFNQFMETYIEITNCPTDIISKVDFLNYYNDVNKRNYKWASILGDIKRLKINYKCNKKFNGVKGCIVGVKFKEDNPKEEQVEVKDEPKKEEKRVYYDLVDLSEYLGKKSKEEIVVVQEEEKPKKIIKKEKILTEQELETKRNETVQHLLSNYDIETKNVKEKPKKKRNDEEEMDGYNDTPFNDDEWDVSFY